MKGTGMVFSDSHCHLDRYQPEWLAEELKRARLKNIDIIISVGTTLESSVETVRLAQSHRGVLAAVGIHPWNAIPPTDAVRKQLNQLARMEQVVAIGEIGLDYARSPQTKDIQKLLLRYQLSLAQETGLPVNLHCREAHQDMMDILREEISPGLRGLIHGFSDDQAELGDWLDLGFYVSIGMRGFIINEKPHLPAVVRDIPLDRLLTETDSTGSAEPAGPTDVLLVVDKLASIKGVTPEKIANTATTNLKRLLKL